MWEIGSGVSTSGSEDVQRKLANPIWCTLAWHYLTRSKTMLHARWIWSWVETYFPNFGLSNNKSRLSSVSDEAFGRCFWDMILNVAFIQDGPLSKLFLNNEDKIQLIWLSRPSCNLTIMRKELVMGANLTWENH